MPGFFVILFFHFCGTAFAVIPFTGRADLDFSPEACLQESAAKDVGMPNAFPAAQTSGFDVQAICYSYDPANDTLYIGLQTYPDAAGVPVIFGDADGDGDPSSAGAVLQSLLGSDNADLAGAEFITLAIDFNRDSAPDLVAGVSTSGALAQFKAVGGAAPPDNILPLAPLEQFYGAPLARVSANLAFLPTAARPHLEFWVTGVSQVPGFAALDFSDPDSWFQFYLTAGSFDDDGIAEEAWPNIVRFQKMNVGMMLDADTDGMNDALDSDDDNDTIPDLLEQDLSDWDTNGDGNLSLAEVQASGQDTNGNGEINANDVGIWPDTDADGFPDPFDSDSDGDGISDRMEAGALPAVSPGMRDSDGDGIPDFRETDSDDDGLLDAAEDADRNGAVGGGETDPTKFDTDGDFLCDGAVVTAACTGAEGDRGTDPLKADTDGDFLCDGAVIVPPCVQSEKNLKTDPLDADSDDDGLSDGIEVQAGRDPLYAESDSLSKFNIDPAVPPPVEAAESAPLGGDVDLTQGAVWLQGSGCSMFAGGGGATFLVWWVLLLFGFGILPRAWGLNADGYRNNSNGLGFFNYESVETLPRRQFSLGLSQHIAHNPIGFGLRTTSQILDNVVSYYYVWDIWGALGVYENWDVGLNFPVSLATQIEDLNSSTESNTSSVGDIRLQAKYRFLEFLAAQVFLDLPSGNSNDFFGEGNATGGVKVIGEKIFETARWGAHQVGGHLGILGRGTQTIAASNRHLLGIGPEMLWGAGWRGFLSKEKDWAALIHLWGKSDFDAEATSPVEWDLGFQKIFEKIGLQATMGIGFGMNKGYGAPDYRLIVAFDYLPSKKRGETLPAFQARLEGKEIVVLKPIPFEVNRAVLRPEALPVLEDVAELLATNPSILKLRIDGHTDSDGSEPFNLRLSQERAGAVKNYLVSKGIVQERLVTKGWGESHPVLRNDSAAAKAKNRRVEFHVVEAESY